MFKRPILFAAAALVLSSAALAPARAQSEGDYRERLEDLVTISSIFGELHHIRRNCTRSESDVWRERMKKLIEYEGPQGPARDRMVSAFNSGYQGAQNRFDYCDRRARDYAAARAQQGDAIIARLMAPLYETLGEEGDVPTVWRGGQSQ